MGASFPPEFRFLNDPNEGDYAVGRPAVDLFFFSCVSPSFSLNSRCRDRTASFRLPCQPRCYGDNSCTPNPWSCTGLFPPPFSFFLTEQPSFSLTLRVTPPPFPPPLGCRRDLEDPGHCYSARMLCPFLPRMTSF